MNSPLPFPPELTAEWRSRRMNERAVALVIVLAFVVLLTGVTVAFFSSTLLYRQISNSSASEAKVDLFAQGAVDTIVGDLKQEVAAGSNVTRYTDASGNVVGQASLPVNAYTAVPAQALKGTQSNVTSFAPNLVKRSAFQQNFFPAGADSGAGNYATGTLQTVPLGGTGTAPAAGPATPSNRAANVASTSPSQNGRYISAARWNKPLLLPKAVANQTSDTDLTPDATKFVVPDWVLVDRTGNNPTTVSSAVVGRYAYAIYDEGGLLDANVAGYPINGNPPYGAANSDQASSAKKGVLAFADLTQLPGISALSASRQQTVINALVGWRNSASGQATGSLLAGYSFPAAPSPSPWPYSLAMLGNSSGFLQTANTTLQNGQSDRMFSSRQELIRLLVNGVGIQGNGGQTDRANLQNSLQCLGTFNRGLNQPSYIPGTYSGGTSPTQPTAAPIASGGNDAAPLGGDAKINPAFLKARVTAAFTRSDGSTAALGDPLVAKRFALSRLAWITFKGPISDDNGTLSTDPDIQLVITQLQNQGVSLQLLKQGGPTNIQKYFGLSWVTDTNISAINDGTKKWHYLHGNSGNQLAILRLDQITGRDPDFFELLKAAVTVGAEAKSAGVLAAFPSVAVPTVTSTFQTNRDTSTDAFIIQLGANIINQAAVDGYPRRILFDDGGSAGGAQEYRGVADVPYIYRTRGGYFKLHEANPAVDANTTPNPGPIIDYGLGIFLEQPEIWNPHTWNPTTVGAVPATLRPTKFRFAMMSNQLPNYAALPPTVPLAYSRNADYNGKDPDPSNALEPKPISLTEAKTELDFSIPTGRADLFREPTLLNKPNIPAGTNLQTGPQHFLRTDSTVTPYTSSGSARSVYQSVAYTSATPPVADNQLYLGVYFGSFPLWIADSSSPGKYVASSRATFSSQTNFLYRLEFQDPSDSSKWATYEEKFMPLSFTDRSGNPDQEFGLGTNVTAASAGGDHMVASSNQETCCDPRTARFSTEPLTSSNTANYYVAPPYIPYQSGWIGWANASQNAVWTGRSDECPGDPGIVAPAAASQGMYNHNSLQGGNIIAFGWYMQNDPSLPNSIGMCNYPSANGQGGTSASQYYTDADGVARRAMGAYVTSSVALPATPSGLPARKGATVYNGSGVGSPSTEGQSRPLILNRPFRTVAELGYVFSGTPWKNIDFFTPESGFAGLLDLFCINDTESSNGMLAGQVNLNTRQAPVLKAILTGAYKDEAALLSAVPGLSASESDSLVNDTANGLLARTSSTTAPKGPLRNLSDFVGKWTGSPVNASAGGIDGKSSFDGFSKDLGNIAVISSSNAMKSSQRYRESVIRALSGCGQTRVWNLMVDLIAQTGRYPANAQSLSGFTVEGEQRYWVHLAIDRYTGQVIDKQIEIVKE